MRQSFILLSVLAFLVTRAPLHAQAVKALPVDSAPAPESGSAFEGLPTLDASVILLPQFYQGPNFQVRRAVEPYQGSNHYLIDSRFGTFQADGNKMLMRRIAEINGIASLQDMSHSDEFKKGLKESAKAPLDAAQNLVTDPVATIASVPKGIMGFLKRTGQSVKEMADRQPSNAQAGNAIENISGYSKVKRNLALKLGVDPYCTNEVFQEELSNVAKPAFAGGFAVTLGFSALSGGVGTAVSALNLDNTLMKALEEKGPSELRRMNADLLINRMGVSERTAQAFLNNVTISPTTQTLLVAALAKLGNIPGQADFIRNAAGSEDEHDALAFQQCVELMVLLNATSPVVRISRLGSLTICQTKDGAVVVPIQWDYAAWTPLTERFITALQGQQLNPPATGYAVMLTGDISPLAAQACAAHGIKVTTKALPGPLK